MRPESASPVYYHIKNYILLWFTNEMYRGRIECRSSFLDSLPAIAGASAGRKSG